jgi:hypothetical protein
VPKKHAPHVGFDPQAKSGVRVVGIEADLSLLIELGCPRRSVSWDPIYSAQESRHIPPADDW